MGRLDCGLIVILGLASCVGGQEAAAEVSPDGSVHAVVPMGCRRREQDAALAAVREWTRVCNASAHAALGESFAATVGVVGNPFDQIAPIDIALKHAEILNCEAAEAAGGPRCGLGARVEIFVYVLLSAHRLSAVGACCAAVREGADPRAAAAHALDELLARCDALTAELARLADAGASAGGHHGDDAVVQSVPQMLQLVQASRQASVIDASASLFARACEPLESRALLDRRALAIGATRACVAPRGGAAAGPTEAGAAACAYASAYASEVLAGWPAHGPLPPPAQRVELACEVWASLLTSSLTPAELRAAADGASVPALDRAGLLWRLDELIATRVLRMDGAHYAHIRLTRALEAAPDAERPRLRALHGEVRAMLASSPFARKLAEESAASNAREGARPELALFARCALALARNVSTRADFRIYVATDNSVAGEALVSLLGGHGVLNGAVRSRIDGHAELLGDAAQTADALVDLAILSRAKAMVGTHLSTFSMLAAGMGAAGAHAVGFPTRHGECALVASPLASWVPSAFASAQARELYSFGIEQLRALPCADEPGFARALLAVGGDGVLRPGADAPELVPPGSAAWDELLAHALATAADDADAADAARTAAERREVASVRRLIAAHEARVRCLAPDAAGCADCPVRLLLGRAYAFNVANRATSYLAYALMALATDRVLVVDGGWLPGLQLGGGVRLDALEPRLRARALAVAGGEMSRQVRNWHASESGFCGELVPDACDDDAVEICAAHAQGAPNAMHAVANRRLRGWYEAHVGYGGAGLRELMRWLFKPSDDVAARAAQVEAALCGAARGCEVAVHLRRGTLEVNFFFPRVDHSSVLSQ